MGFSKMVDVRSSDVLQPGGFEIEGRGVAASS